MKLSLRSKAILTVVLITAAFTAATAAVSNAFVKRIIDREYLKRANDLAYTVAVSLDAESAGNLCDMVMTVFRASEKKIGTDQAGTPDYEDYIAQFSGVTKSAEYSAILGELRRIQSVNDVDCIYITCVDPLSRSAVYVLDAALEDACPPGSFDKLYEFNYGVLNDPKVGFPAYSTNTEEYGWLVSAGAPIVTDSGKVVGYAMIDISMDEVRELQRGFVIQLILIFIALMVVVAAVTILLGNSALVKPIKQLASAAAGYTAGDQHYSRRLFDGLRIKNKDEIGLLADSMRKMGSEINDHIASLIAVNKELSSTRRTAERMGELAVRDQLTGVRNRTGYVRVADRLNEEIKNGTASFCLAMVDLNFLKKTNDEFGHDAGDAAIKKTCEVICGVFAHSPVFRIGGDEFVVVLENNDFAKVEELVKQFRDKLKEIANDTSKLPYERISASIGYAVFDHEIDADVDDVLRRADKEMYEDKKRMKTVRTY